MSTQLGQCCTQDFHLGDRVECISSGDCGWIYRVKRAGIKDSFVICWIDGPKAGEKQIFFSQKVCDDFAKEDPEVNDISQADLTINNRI